MAGRGKTVRLLTALLIVLLVLYATITCISLAWFEHEHTQRHHFIRDPDAVNSFVSERYTTPAYWSKAMATWRVFVLLCVFLLLMNPEPEGSPWLADVSFRFLILGILIEIAIFAYLLAERYPLGCNTCTYSPNTCHGRNWCDACGNKEEGADVCPNTGPMQIGPEKGISRYWRRRTTASGVALVLIIGMAICVWLCRRFTYAVTKSQLRRELGLAHKFHLLCVSAFTVSMLVLQVGGIHSFSWERVAVKETNIAATPDGEQPDLTVADARFGISWFVFTATALALLPCLTGYIYLITERTRWVESMHTIFSILGVAVLTLLVVVCTIAFLSCNNPAWPYNPCNDSRFCCVYADALNSGAADKCIGITQNCPPGTVVSPTLLHANRPFQIVYVTGGFALFFSLLSYVSLYAAQRARARVRDQSWEE